MLVVITHWNCLAGAVLISKPYMCYSAKIKLGHSISYKIACVPNEDSDQPVHLNSLSVFTGLPVGSQISKAPSGAQQRL